MHEEGTSDIDTQREMKRGESCMTAKVKELKIKKREREHVEMTYNVPENKRRMTQPCRKKKLSQRDTNMQASARLKIRQNWRNLEDYAYVSSPATSFFTERFSAMHRMILGYSPWLGCQVYYHAG